MACSLILFFLLFCHREVRSYVGWISDLFSWRSPDEGKGGDGWMVDDDDDEGSIDSFLFRVYTE